MLLFPRGELSPLSRETARPVLPLLPALRPPRVCSPERRGGSADTHGVAVDELPIDDPPELLPDEEEPPLELLLELPPELPPELDPPSPPRGADVPVVLPFDVRSCAAQAAPAVRLPTANVIANVLTNLSRNITPPSVMRTDL